MRPILRLCLVALSAALPTSLSAQGLHEPAPKERVALARELDAFARPSVQIEEGVVRVAGRDYKAAVDAGGMSFVPFLGSDAPRNLPLDFATRSVRVGAIELSTAAAEPRLDGDTIFLARPDFVESFRIDAAGLEQAFRFDRLPKRSAIRIDIGVRSEFAASTAADGVRFEHALGSVRYGRAVAIDAKGARVELQTSWNGDGIRIDVPADFVEHATLPLIVDPLIGTMNSIASIRTTRSVDFAYDTSLGRFVMVWERVYSATDSDVYAVALDGAMNLASPVLTVDTSTESWEHCRVANFGEFDSFLVVASRKLAGQDPWIAGRIVQGGPSFSVGVALDIDRPGNSSGGVGVRYRPVVAGDLTPGAPGIAAVAWEFLGASGVPMVRACYVRDDGTRHAIGDFQASVVGEDASEPEISDYIGPNPANTRYAIAYHRRYDNGVNTIHQLLGSILERGNLGVIPFGLQVSLLSDSHYSVSAPIDDGTPSGTCLVVCDAYHPSTSSRDIVATVLSLSGGNSGPGVDLTVLEGLGTAHVGRVQRSPSVTTDGCRFAVAYQNDWTSLDPDVRVMTVAWQRNHPTDPLVVQETSIIANTTSSETAPSIACARNSGEAVRCAVGWNFSSATPSYRVQMQAYDAMAGLGGFTTRATGCGGLTIQASGVPAIGHPITMSLLSIAAVRGFLVGRPVSVALAACPGCTLGVDGTAFQTATLQLTIPCDAALVGATVGFQAFDTASPACLGLVRLSDTVDVRLR